MSPKEFQQLYLELRERDERREAIIWRCETDEETFALVYFPHYCQDEFNEFHHQVFDDFKPTVRGTRMAYGAPRGSAKSTLKALVEPVHDVCYGHEKFIILISGPLVQAVQKLKDIRSELLTNDLLVSDFGIHFSSKRPGETQFEVHSNAGSVFFMAFSRGAQIRGIRYGQHRPSKVIIDDAEDSEEVYNERIREKDHNWFKEDVSKVGDKNTNIEFIGTVLHRDSLLKKVLRNPAYTSKVFRSVIEWSSREDLWDKWRMIYTNIDDDKRFDKAEVFYKKNSREMLKNTKVLWPTREPYLYLMKEMVEIGRRAFFKEKQNQPLGADERIFEEIHWYRETSDGLLIERSKKLVKWNEVKNTAIGVIDPADGKVTKGKQGDFSVIASGLTDNHGRVFVHKDWTKRAPPTKWIAEIFELHDLLEYNKFGVETNLYRSLLMTNLVAERKRREKEKKRTIRIPFYDIDNTENKEKRITMLEPKVTHGWMLFNRGLSNEFMAQIEDFPHADHDDAPDAVEMLWKLAHNAYRASPVSIGSLGMR